MTTLTGTGHMIRLILRRDRFLLPVWVLFGGLMPSTFVASYEALYPTAADQAGYARTAGTSPTLLGLYGPLYDNGLGGIAAQRAGFLPVVIAVICALTVIRHTRTEEEAGRRELLGATVLGRGAALAAALLVTLGACVLVGAIVFAGYAAQGLDVGGSLALGVQFVLAGWVFAAVAVVAAQLSESAALARGVALAAVGVAFATRMAADIGGIGNGLSWLSWLSPLGWGTRLQVFGDERWWVAALPVLLTAALVALAGAVSARRDVGAGILPPRPGPAAAAPSLSGPFSLAWRLHGRTLIGWLTGFAALGLIFGAIGDSVQEMFADSPDLQEMFLRIGGSSALLDAFYASIMNIVGLFAAGYAVSAGLRARSEENDLHAEPVLATRIGKVRWLSSHVVFALGGSAAGLVACGAVAGLVHGVAEGNVARELPRILGAALVQLPAVWLVGAVALAFIGLLPRFAAAGGWAMVALTGTITMFGSVLQADQWLMDLSPFTHVPKLPGNDLALPPIAWLGAATLVLGAAGLAAFRRRDMATG